MQIYAAHPEDRMARTAALFSEVCLRTARLVALWQCVGFCHGYILILNFIMLQLTQYVTPIILVFLILTI